MLKTSLWLCASILLYLGCAAVLYFFYRDSRASLEMAIPTTILALVVWLTFLFWRRESPAESPTWMAGLFSAAATFVVLFVYGWLINGPLGNYHPIVSIFGSSTSKIFVDDTGLIYQLIVIPIFSIFSGIVHATAIFSSRQVK